MPKYGIGIYVFDSEYKLYLVKKPKSRFGDKGKKWLVPGETFEESWDSYEQDQINEKIDKILIKESPISEAQLSRRSISIHLLGSWTHKQDNQDFIFYNYVVISSEVFRHLPENGRIKDDNITGESFHILELPVDKMSPLTMDYFKSLLFQYSGYIPSATNDKERKEFKDFLSNDHKKYFLFETIGKGGYGLVYATLDIVTLLPRVVKIPRANPRDNTWQERFLSEGTTLLLLIHDRVQNIEEIFSINRIGDSRYYLLKEFIRGENLQKVPEIKKDHVQVIIGTIVRTLAEVHKRRICHRDLKPNNIMIEFFEDESPKITLIDFGLVKRLQIDAGKNPNLTAKGFRTGSPFFQSYVTYNSYKKHNLLDDYYSVLLIFYWLFDKKSFYDDYFKPPQEVEEKVRNCKSDCKDPFLEEDVVENYCKKWTRLPCIKQFSEFHKVVRQAYNDIYEIGKSGLKVKNENKLQEQLEEVEKKILKIFG